ncbi:MAG: ATP-dependent protease [Xanthomonadaceae bacterium]|nr:ATP-dependent protease [Xanthomonadaceae bacterium]
MDAAASTTLPLLPYHTVLVPGGVLTLRLVASTQLELVRECGRRDTDFGICLAVDGHARNDSLTASFGTEARIEDFSSGTDGVPTLRVRGRRRFHVRQRHVDDSGLILATIEWCELDADDPVRPEHAVLVLILERILEQAGVQATPARLDDSAWVGWRLVEWLPLDDEQRLALLQQDDPHDRLDQLVALLS